MNHLTSKGKFGLIVVILVLGCAVGVALLVHNEREDTAEFGLERDFPLLILSIVLGVLVGVLLVFNDWAEATRGEILVFVSTAGLILLPLAGLGVYRAVNVPNEPGEKDAVLGIGVTVVVACVVLLVGVSIIYREARKDGGGIGKTTHRPQYSRINSNLRTAEINRIDKEAKRRDKGRGTGEGPSVFQSDISRIE